MSMTQGIELTDAVLPTGNPFLATLDHPQLEDGVSSVKKVLEKFEVPSWSAGETTQPDGVQVGIYKERKKKKEEGRKKK